MILENNTAFFLFIPFPTPQGVEAVMLQAEARVFINSGFGGAFAGQNLVYMDIYLCRFFYEFQKDLAKCTGSTPVTQLQHWNHIQVLALC